MSQTGNIIFDGQSSSAHHLFVTEYPNYQKPQRKVDVYSVPGRSGDIIYVQDAWNDVAQEYRIATLTGTEDSVPGDLTDISAWLYAPKGYKILRDDFDISHFRKAYFSGPFDVENTLGRSGEATISFTCQPQRYRDAGQIAQTISTSGGTVSNPTAYHARPVLKVTGGASGGTVTVNGTVFSINSLSVPVIINCEEMNCYDANGNNKNSIVTSSTSEFATLAPGANTISFTGSVTSVEVTPNYWDL